MYMCANPEPIPSGSDWDMDITMLGTESPELKFDLTFNSTGQLQDSFTQPVPTLESEIANSSGISFEEWYEVIGRTFYVLYWLYLADLGQVTTLITDPSWNLTHPSLHNDTYNVFADEALYQNYLEFYSSPPDSSVPYLSPTNRISGDTVNSSFSPLQPIDTMFLQSYSCQQRQLKSGVSLVLALIVADYPFIVGGFSLVIWVATFWQKRPNNGSYTLCLTGAECSQKGSC
jgi:hypothetical protein